MQRPVVEGHVVRDLARCMRQKRTVSDGLPWPAMA